MEEYFVSYEQALRLKELGFDWKCNRYYTNGYANHDPEDLTKVVKLHYDSPYNHNQVISADGTCYSAPRLDQAQAWLREEKGWDVTPIPTLAEYGKKKYRWDICHWSNPEYGDSSRGIFDTYQDALSAGITKTMELLTA